MSDFLIYKASAGSGKTFQLALQYLQLVITDPRKYRSILAVTFTNKATAEMKSRILEELAHLASGEPSGYLNLLKEHTTLQENIIRQRAELVLNHILHDYSCFSICTIDSFFQRVIRGFSREIGLQGGYDIELDSNRVLDEVIDILLMNLDSNEGLRAWLLEFAEDLLKDGKSWNFRQLLSDFAGELFQEAYKDIDGPMLRKLADKDFMKEFRTGLHTRKNTFVKTLKNFGEKGLSLIKQFDLSPDDFKQKKSGPGAFFVNLTNPSEKFICDGPNSYVRKAIEDTDNWLPSKASAALTEKVNDALNAGLFDCLNEAIKYRSEHISTYLSDDAVLKNLYTLGVLADLSKELKTYCQENNILLLPDSSELLRKIIGPSDTPFVYEKLGSYYQNYMIDEFQDTSGLQWDNFRPLLENALAGGNKCLIVGDVKQSIYRWRSGDWQLLAEKAKNEFKQFQPKEITLDQNWRSAHNIVRFNNTFFSIAPVVFQNLINEDLDKANNASDQKEWFQSVLINAYNDHHQKCKADATEGFIHIEFTPQDSSLEDNHSTWKENALDKMGFMIRSLEDHGVAAGEITILVRKATDGKEVAEWLFQEKEQNKSEKYCYDVISNDSLLIGSSPVVKFLIAFLQYVHDPSDLINRTFLVSEYIRYIYPVLKKEERLPLHFLTDKTGQGNLFSVSLQNQDDDLNPLFNGTDKFIEQIFPFFSDPIKMLPEYFSFNSLYEGIQEIIRYFGLNNLDQELPFIQSFMDEVIAFGKSENSDLGGFLDWWSIQGFKHTINASEKQNAIRIITIHKSKGLQFRAVLIPFCDWDIFSHFSNIIWCHPNQELFKNMNLLPVKYNKRLASSSFAEDYFLEEAQTYLDNLNLFYVAFTRAEEFFWAFAPQGNGKSISSMGDLLYSVLAGQYPLVGPQSEDVFSSDDFHINENLIFEKGFLMASDKKIIQDESVRLSLKGIRISDFSSHLKIKNHSQNYFILDNNEHFIGLNEGLLIHELLSEINIPEDLSQAIHQMIFDGRLTIQEAELYQQKISSLISTPEVKDWFSNHWDIYNERSIIRSKGTTKRPDRVLIQGKQVIVIDFKSGEKESKSHHYQVQNYLKLFKEMGYSDLKGYLWYLQDNRIIPVSLN